MNERYMVEMCDIQKSYAGVKALSNGKIQVKPGEIHALIGENGAGKSTLMKVLSGAIKREKGTLCIDGENLGNLTTKEAQQKGVSIIYQELALAPSLTVAENIFIDHLTNGSPIINWKELNRKAKELLAQLGFYDIEPKSTVSSLSVAYQQVVEICKALSKKVKVMILDEPTAVLTFGEIEKLFTILRKLRNDGVSIIYISHRLDEIFALSDRITIMKDGTYVNTVNTAEINKETLVNLMVGRELTSLFPIRNATIGDTMLSVEHLMGGALVNDISFEVKKGEVIGFYGLVGSGRTEIMRTIIGAEPKKSGRIIFDGKEEHFKSPKIALKKKLGMLPENRKEQGVLLYQSIAINSTITALQKIQTRLKLLNKKKEQRTVTDLLSSINTRYATVHHPVYSLSGGNQQKVALAKWLFASCKCIIFDEPTRGVDVGAKAEIYHCINELAESGLAIVMVSSEMTELLGTCDRIIVVRQGNIVGEETKANASEERLIQLAMGIK